VVFSARATAWKNVNVRSHWQGGIGVEAIAQFTYTHKKKFERRWELEAQGGIRRRRRRRFVMALGKCDGKVELTLILVLVSLPFQA
jgi:hypothetical protein